MDEKEVYFSLLIGIVGGLIVAMSNLVANCSFFNCTAEKVSIHISILITLSIVLFVVFVKTCEFQLKRKRKIKEKK